MDLFYWGILLVIVGLILLIWEVHMPGFFIAIPGTILIVLGSSIMIIGNIDPILASILVLIAAVAASIFTLLFYRKIGSPEPPTTTTIDKLVGRAGIVTAKIEPNNLKGKVRIDSEIWSATSDNEIEVGKKVVVVRGEGVHLFVREVK